MFGMGCHLSDYAIHKELIRTTTNDINGDCISEILLLLAADDPDERDWQRAAPTPGKLFLVGDPKQSIYRFRKAEVSLFIKAYEGHLFQHIAPEPLQLRVNFRSNMPIVDWVNQTFPAVMPTHSDPVTGAVSYSESLTGDDICRHLKDHGVPDLFPDMTAADRDRIQRESKIPKRDSWRERVEAGSASWDGLLTEAALMSFTKDQAALDDRIRKFL